MNEKPKHWYETLPAILTGIAAVAGSITALVLTLQPKKQDAPNPKPPGVIKSVPQRTPVADSFGNWLIILSGNEIIGFAKSNLQKAKSNSYVLSKQFKVGLYYKEEDRMYRPVTGQLIQPMAKRTRFAIGLLLKVSRPTHGLKTKRTGVVTQYQLANITSASD